MFVIKIIGTASGVPNPVRGAYLRSYDPDGQDGRGSVIGTDDPSKALRFATQPEAWDCWRQRSIVKPNRPDGKPNRPLTAFTVEVVAAP